MGVEPTQPHDDEAVLRDLRRQAAATPPLEEGEEARLLERSAQGDQPSQDRLVAANMGMVIRLAQEREEKGLPVPDLVQEGSLGLVEAVKTYASSGDPSFVHFAETRVGQQMDAALAEEAAAVRDGELLVTAANDYERAEIGLRRELQREATEAEIAEKLEWSLERTRYLAQVVADARRRHDEELLAFIDPDAIEIDDTVDGE